MTGWMINKGDVGIYKDINIHTSANADRDLSGLSAVLNVWQDDPLSTILISSKSLSITDAAGGVARWTVAQADIDALPTGVHNANVKLYSGTIYIERTEPFTVEVKFAR